MELYLSRYPARLASLKELGLNMPMRFDMILDRGKDGNLFIRLDNFQPSPAKAETTLKRRRAYRPPPSYMPASQIEERRLSDGRYHTAEEAARLGMNWNNHS